MALAAYPANTLGKHLIDGYAARIAGKSFETLANRYLFPAHGSSVIRSDSCWIGKPTCVPRWSLGFHGILLTRKHLVTVRHISQGFPGATCTFVGADNTPYTYTSVNRTYINPGLVDRDLVVIELNTDVNAAITPAKILPANVASILVPQYRVPVPCAVMNRDQAAFQYGIDYPFTAPNIIGVSCTEIHGYSTDQSWWYFLSIGDSGSQALWVVNGEYVGLGCFTSSTSCTALHENISDINAITGGGDYALQTVDLSGFTVPDAASPADPPDNTPLTVPATVYTDSECPSGCTRGF